MRELRKRLLETEAQMTKILQAMEGVSSQVQNTTQQYAVSHSTFYLLCSLFVDQNYVLVQFVAVQLMCEAVHLAFHFQHATYKIFHKAAEFSGLP